MNDKLQIIPIPAFKDNYIWLIHNGIEAAIVDPGDSAPVIVALERLKLVLRAILITHHHDDHIGGVNELAGKYPEVVVYAPALEQYAFAHTGLTEPNAIELKSLNIAFSVLNLPGHTLGHIAYYCRNQQLLFCGDTLFGAGCGRLFEGTAPQLYESLQKLASLPPSTKVYCSHEYTMSNINFAMKYEPNNKMLIERFNDTKKIRELDLPSLPTTIKLELETNPFLRCSSHEIQLTIQMTNHSEIDIFRKLRELRNSY